MEGIAAMKTTKKAEKAAAVAAAKFAAYRKKARALAGWVVLSDNAVKIAYDGGYTAEDFAVTYANQTAVGAAIWPLKVAAVKAAGDATRKQIDEMTAKLKAAAWVVSEVAPRPASNDCSYKAESQRRTYNLYQRLFRFDYSQRDGAKMTASRDEQAEARYISQAEEDAAYQYNLFVLKLVSKIGEGAIGAVLDGDHVWSYSILTVTMNDGRVDRWKTQQITNCSKLGNYFPQWPSRLMKAKG